MCVIYFYLCIQKISVHAEAELPAVARNLQWRRRYSQTSFEFLLLNGAILIEEYILRMEAHVHPWNMFQNKESISNITDYKSFDQVKTSLNHLKKKSRELLIQKCPFNFGIFFWFFFQMNANGLYFHILGKN